MKSVSILTPTTCNRKDFLRFVAEGISKQDYKKIIEWVIVDGTCEDDSDLPTVINELKKIKTLPKIVFIPQDKNRNNNIGALRNILNKTATGDIFVNFDDDDYYFPKRVSSAVNALVSSKKEIAACSALYLYDNDFQKLFKLRGFGPNHGTACTFAYTKKYTETHKLDDAKTFAEESSFTNAFSEPMVQLDANSTIINTSHGNNTYSKKRIIWDGIDLPDNSKEKMLQDMGSDLRAICKDKDYIKKYLSLVNTSETNSVYDVVYHCGGRSIQWDPEDKTLGGSEQAVIYLSEQWAKNGLRVGVYGNLTKEHSMNGVDYFHYSKFMISHKYKVVIMWRLFGVFALHNLKLKTDKLFFDMHDKSMFEKQYILQDKMDQTTNICLKSQFHLEHFLTTIKSQHLRDQICERTLIIPSGIRKEVFVNTKNIQRSKYRMCYCSCYTRGLALLLAYFFPTLKKLVPQVELHVYYGMNGVTDEKFKNGMKQLLEQPGVTDHGRQSADVICEEKYRSNFHLYYTASEAEIDCISIKESAYTGRIPILSNVNLFKDRPGIHLPGDPTLPQSHIIAAHEFANLLKNEIELENVRNLCQKSDILLDWTQVAKEWSKKF